MDRERCPKVKNEKHYLDDSSFRRFNVDVVTLEKAKRAAKIARLRGMMKAYYDDGCMGSYWNTKAQLDSLLKNINADYRK